MDDWSWLDSSADYSGGDDDWNFYDDYGSDDNDYDMTDWWNSTGGNTDSGDWSYDLGNGSYGGGDNYSYGQDPVDGNGTGTGSGYNWSGLIGAGVQAGGSWLSAIGKNKMTKEQMEYAAKLERENYAAKLAENEKYYQAHGKQLSDAYQKYKGYYVNPNLPENQQHRETNIFGLLTPHPTTGPLANGW